MFYEDVLFSDYILLKFKWSISAFNIYDMDTVATLN